jgi:carboxyl-terminal processing protease
MYPPRPWPRPRLSFLSMLVPVILLAFLVGILTERLGWIPGGRAYNLSGLEPTFDEAWRDVQRYYVDRDAVKAKPLTDGAIEGMLDALGDFGHTRYLTREELAAMRSALKGNMEGIGARMTVRKKLPTVVQTMPDSPARKAGLKPGDVILFVNGKPMAGQPLRRVAELVRGPAGTPVDLKIAREGESKVRTFHITRGKVEVPFVIWQMLPGTPVAHISLLEFGVSADDQLKEALLAARKRGAKGLLVDLRANPGGIKDQAVAVTSEFLKSGVVFIEKDAQGDEEKIKVVPGGLATDLPLVVLIDEGTASSAEIFAGAIQDHKRGKLVGTKTFGTGTVLRQFILSDGSALLLAVAEWLTPNGRQIWHHGITPDIEVTLPRDAEVLWPGDETNLTAEALAKSSDQQLLRGLEVLRQQIKAASK